MAKDVFPVAIKKDESASLCVATWDGMPGGHSHAEGGKQDTGSEEWMLSWQMKSREGARAGNQCLCCGSRENVTWPCSLTL